MFFVQPLLVFTSLALAAAASPHEARQATIASCSSTTVKSSSVAQVGNNTVTLEVLACSGATALTAEGFGLGDILCHLLPIFCPPKPYKPPPPPKPTTKTVTTIKTTTVTDIETKTDTVTATQTVTATVTVSPSPTPTATNVCGAICDTTCGQLGQLPPTTDDCQVIKDSIQVFEGNSAPTFVVDPLHIQQLTFGTCRFFFENLGTYSLEYCWQDLANQGSVAATTCFPPTQPTNSLTV